MTPSAIIADKLEYAKAVSRVKKRVARWPSAYASAMVVREYKKSMAAKKKAAYLGSRSKATGLARWFAEKWIDIKTGRPCGAVHTPWYYPTCRPSRRVTKSTPVIADAIGAANKKKMILQKQTARSNTVHYRETTR